MGRWRWGVEPTMFLYMMAYMLTSVVEEDLIVYKACTATHNYSTEICRNISQPQYQREKQIVQVTVSWFHMWENIASHAVPAVLALFLGSWSDRVGRKIPLLMGLFGGLIYSSAILINSVMVHWRIEWILLTGALPCGLTGGPLAVFMAAFAYLADTTTEEARTFRTTFLEVSYLITMPTGVALGSFLFNKVFERSHAVMFALNCACLVLSIVYSWMALERKTSGAVKPSDESCSSPPSLLRQNDRTVDTVKEGTARRKSGFVDGGTQLFDSSDVSFRQNWIGQRRRSSRSVCLKGRICTSSFILYISRHVSESIKTLVRPREEHRRKLLYLCLTALALYTFQREEKHSIYLYTQLRFNWDVATFSVFRTFQSILYIVGLLLGVPILNKVMGIKDTVIMMIGAISHIAARITFSLSSNATLIYVGGGLGLLGPIVAPVIRSSVSKLVPSYERGKVFALLSVSDMAVPLISGALYSLVYSQTITTFPQAVFILTIASQIIVFITAVWMECLLKHKPIKQAEERDTDAQHS